MIGVLIVTHGGLAKSFIETAQLLVGNQEKLMGIGLFEGDSPDMLQDEIIKDIKYLDDGDGVIIFVDIYGGTPSNRAALSSVKMDSKVECITGVNLPMLVDCLLTRTSFTLEQLKSHCVETGHSSIKDLLKEIGQTK